MDIIGSINVDGDVVLNENATSEIKNAYLERLTTAAEIELAATLGLPHYSRLIFNVDTGKLKAWDGSKFVTIGGAADTAQAQLNLLQVSLGAFISPSGSFNVGAFSAFANINTTTATSLHLVLKAVDTKLGSLQQTLSATMNASGLTPGGLLAPVTGSHYLDGIASILAGLLQLDQKAFDLNTRLNNAHIEQIEIPFTNTASITAAHNLNYQYCRVLCVNQSNVSITPTSIAYTNANNLTVTLAAALTGKLVITGKLVAL